MDAEALTLAGSLQEDAGTLSRAASDVGSFWLLSLEG